MTQTGPADLFGGDEARVLKHLDVLLHPGQRHAVRRRELTDRRAPGAETLEHVTPGGVGKRDERTVDVGGLILNHRVQYYTSRKVMRPPGAMSAPGATEELLGGAPPVEPGGERREHDEQRDRPQRRGKNRVL